MVCARFFAKYLHRLGTYQVIFCYCDALLIHCQLKVLCS